VWDVLLLARKSGKVELLQSVHSSGSISAGAQAITDYKRAWLLIDSLNRAFLVQVLERNTGGAGGAGAKLTPFGQESLGRVRRSQDLATISIAANHKAGRQVRKTRPLAGGLASFSRVCQRKTGWPCEPIGSAVKGEET
jgi:molybdate transport system regulatory protein